MNKDRPRERELPKYITIDAHDGEGNSRPVRYINERAIDIFEVKVNSALKSLRKYATMEEEE